MDVMTRETETWLPKSADRIPLLILRLIFACITIGWGVVYAVREEADPRWFAVAVGVGVILMAVLVIIIDLLTHPKRIEVISAIYFGLAVGILLTYLLSVHLNPLLEGTQNLQAIQLLMATFLCYVCISLLLQTKDNFRFVIPYVEFSRELKGSRPLILDTSSIIDGRLAELADTDILDSQLLLPSFALAELQSIADSSDRLRRARGRRGLDILNRLRTHEKLDFQIYDRDLPELSGQPVDMKLVLLAKQLGGRLVTGDYNLNKVARLHNVPVINLNEVANSLRLHFLPGEGLQIRVVKPGEGPGQGVGYLDDGTMVVVEGGRDRLGKTLPVVVTSSLQTNAGRMIFAKLDDSMQPVDSGH
jgi:uncharacterized protein YacL